MMLLAQALAGFGIVHLLILVIIVAAVVAIVAVVLKQMGIVVPQFIVTILWIVLAAVIGILAIKFVLSMV